MGIIYLKNRKGPASCNTKYAERYNPGAIIPGVMAGIIMVIGFFTNQRKKRKKYQSSTQPGKNV